MLKTKFYKTFSTGIFEVFVNPNNPRMITDLKFQMLKKSIHEAPWMLKLRPIVINNSGMILGGNQRYKACVELGLRAVWVMLVDDLSADEELRFIIRDNQDFGKWDMDILSQTYSQDELLNYGFQVEILKKGKPKVESDVKPPPPMGDDIVDKSQGNGNNQEFSGNSPQISESFSKNALKQIVFELPTDIYTEVIRDLEIISKEYDCDDKSEAFLRLINFYENRSRTDE
jgi:hypothetical protein